MHEEEGLLLEGPASGWLANGLRSMSPPVPMNLPPWISSWAVSRVAAGREASGMGRSPSARQSQSSPILQILFYQPLRKKKKFQHPQGQGAISSK